MARKTKKQPVVETKSVAEYSETLLRRLLANVEIEIKRGNRKATLIREFANLHRAAITGEAEKRKQLRLEAKASEEVTEAAVVEFVRKLNPTQRASLIRELQAIDSRRSGLA